MPSHLFHSLICVILLISPLVLTSVISSTSVHDFGAALNPATGFPFFFYRNESESSVGGTTDFIANLITCTNADCTSSTNTAMTTTTSSSLCENVMVVSPTSGFPVNFMGYFDGLTPDHTTFEVIACTAADCSSFTNRTHVESGSSSRGVGGMSAFVNGSNIILTIALDFNAFSRYDVIACHNDDCTSNTTLASHVTTLGDWVVATVINELGFPSFQRGTEFVHCNNSDCSLKTIKSGVTALIQVMTNYPGTFNPVIIEASNNQPLDLVHCFDPYCTNSTTYAITAADQSYVLTNTPFWIGTSLVFQYYQTNGAPDYYIVGSCHFVNEHFSGCEYHAEVSGTAQSYQVSSFQYLDTNNKLHAFHISGNYRIEKADFVLTNCPGGYEFSPVESCKPCLVGQMRASTNPIQSCTPCSSGSISNADRTDCVACSAGEYVVDNTCVTCPAGTYSASPTTWSGSSLPCTICPAGTFSNAGSDSCTDCDVNEFSTPGSTSCTACGTDLESSAGAAHCSPTPTVSQEASSDVSNSDIQLSLIIVCVFLAAVSLQTIIVLKIKQRKQNQ